MFFPTQITLTAGPDLLAGAGPGAIGKFLKLDGIGEWWSVVTGVYWSTGGGWSLISYDLLSHQATINQPIHPLPEPNFSLLQIVSQPKKMRQRPCPWGLHEDPCIFVGGCSTLERQPFVGKQPSPGQLYCWIYGLLDAALELPKR